MPNTLAHIGVQVLVSRAVLRDADVRWILVGCVIPDLPWIANRALAMLLPSADAFLLRPYWIAQASWFGSLWLCGALALLSSRPRRVFALLALNAFAHLLLDGLQTKWGNGVHLFAPFSWHTWNAGWFWPGSPATVALTLFGVVAVAWALVEVRRAAFPFHWPRLTRLVLAAALLAMYAAQPLLLRDAVLAADAHSLETLGDPELRPGRAAGFDRVWLELNEAGEGQLHVLGGETLRAIGKLTEASASVSARGRFQDAKTIVLEDVHVHGAFPRALASYAGLVGIAAVLVFAAASARGRRERRGAG